MTEDKTQVVEFQAIAPLIHFAFLSDKWCQLVKN